jgi:hypothetical protein
MLGDKELKGFEMVGVVRAFHFNTRQFLLSATFDEPVLKNHRKEGSGNQRYMGNCYEWNSFYTTSKKCRP